MISSPVSVKDMSGSRRMEKRAGIARLMISLQELTAVRFRQPQNGELDAHICTVLPGRHSNFTPDIAMQSWMSFRYWVIMNSVMNNHIIED